MRFLICAILTISSISASATAKPDPRRLAEIVQAVASCSVDGKQLFNAREFAEETLELEQLAGRIFPTDELLRLAKNEIQVRGYKRCFTGSMRVLTPRGYVPIDMLKPGDKVVSWDLKAEKIVINRVRKTFVYENIEYGELPDLALEGRAIQTTLDHRFYSVDLQSYEEIHLFHRKALLANIKDCEFKLVARGAFQFPAGSGSVYTFSLELDPYNYIVEGVLVLDTPGPST